MTKRRDNSQPDRVGNSSRGPPFFQAERISEERSTCLFEFANLGFERFLIFCFKTKQLKAEMRAINPGSQVVSKANPR